MTDNDKEPSEIFRQAYVWNGFTIYKDNIRAEWKPTAKSEYESPERKNGHN